MKHKYSKACPKARRKDKSYYILNETMKLLDRDKLDAWLEACNKR